MSIITTDQLQRFPLFEGLSDDDLARFLPYLHKRAFAKGVYLFFPGSSNTNTYLMVSGLVRLFFTNTHGDEFLLNLVRPPDVFGLPVLERDETRLMGAATFQNSVILSLSSECLMDAMQTMPMLARNLYREASNSARKVLLYNRALVTLDLSARLAVVLLHIADIWQVTDLIEMPINQTQLASWLGASRGRLNQALMDLQARGLIRLQNKSILFLDRTALEKLAQNGR